MKNIFWRRKLFGVLSLFWFMLSFFLLFLSQHNILGTRKIGDFSGLVPQDVVSDNSWYGIYFRGEFIGYSNYYMRMRDFSQGGGYLLRTISKLAINVLGKPQNLVLSSQIILDKSYLLKEAFLSLQSKEYFIHQDIERIAKDQYRLSLKSPSQNIVRTFDMKQNIVSSLLLPVNIHYIPLGKRISISFFDPLLDEEREVFLENKGKTELIVAGDKQILYRIQIESQGLTGDLFVDAKGLLIKADFLGFEFLRQDLEEVIPQGMNLSSKDLLDSFSIESRQIPNLGDVRVLKARVKKGNLDFTQDELTFFNQRAVKAGEYMILEVEKTAVPDEVFGLDTLGMQDYLAEDDFIKKDAPAIRAIVDEVTKDERNSLEILKKLSAWIDANITKVPTFSIPNTLDVLELRQGDCGELSALLVGLLRARGVPSYVNIGVVYQDGRFYYHAWPSVYVGRWIDTDPALCQIIADASHIKFFRGLKKQFEVIKILGDLQIEVLEVKYD